ncbi:M14 family zinc carboxypeptidase [Aquimarina agarilytica]|uniref:M14 family zinc carboxypeptidase n=1 Tax=Aquimarina agarilytica TaxID=1087449 RepID=UPI000288AE29|nr:M14 family zinc carboxypeptidase [Aquimarina agarilytica]
MKSLNLYIKPIVFWIFLIVSIASKAQHKNIEKFYRIEAQLTTEQVKKLKQKGLEIDHFHSENGIITAEISKSDLDLLKANNVKLKIKIRNLGKRLPKRNKRTDRKALRKSSKKIVKQSNYKSIKTPNNFELGSMGGFFTLDEALAILDQMQQKYPNLITLKSSLGNSIENRPIYMVKISDNPTVEEANEEEVLFTAIHHAREPIGLSQMIFYMWHLLENYETDDEIKTLVNNTALYFVPVINPDGYVHNESTNPNGGGFWRKNRRDNGNGTFDVDLNRNYGYLWEPNNPLNTNSQAYRGTKAFSEPETTAIKKFVNSRKFSVALNYHSFSNLLIHPWGYAPNSFTPDNDIFVTMAKYMTAENKYTYGTPHQTLGVFDFGASDDWMYGEETEKPKILAMTPEIGSRDDGFWPASSRIIPLCEASFYLNAKLIRMAALYAKVTSQNETTKDITGVINFDIERFSLKNANWTVSLTSDSPYVKTLGTPVSFNTLKMFEKTNGSISFELNANTPKNEIIPIKIKVTNGIWDYTRTVNLSFEGNTTTACASPKALKTVSITDTTTTLEWNSTDNDAYKLRYKVQGTSNWITVQTPNTTTTTINKLEANTTYEVQIANNCSNYSDSLIFKTNKDDTLSVPNFNQEASVFYFFPNPVKDILFIELNKEDKTKLTYYEIFDTQGKQVQTGIINSNGTIDVSNLSPELYFLIVINGETNKKIKFLKH